MNENPLGIAMIICDQIIIEAKTNKKSLIGTFNNLFARDFPCMHPLMCVFVALTNGNGRCDAKLKCINVDAPELGTIFELPGEIEFGDPNETVEMGFHLKNLTFIKPGIHVIELWCNEVPVLERRLSVTKVAPKEK